MSDLFSMFDEPEPEQPATEKQGAESGKPPPPRPRRRDADETYPGSFGRPRTGATAAAPQAAENRGQRGEGQPCTRPHAGPGFARCSVGGGDAGYSFRNRSYCHVHRPWGFLPSDRAAGEQES